MKQQTTIKKEKIKCRSRLWYAENKERAKERMREYHKTHYKPHPHKLKDVSHLKKLTKIEKAYMAGLFDGEGCIVIAEEVRHSKVISYRLQIALGNQDEPVIFWLKAKFGGRVGLNKRPDKMRYWVASSREAGAILKQIVPFLQIKKQQCLLALSFLEIGRGNHRAKLKMKREISSLNKNRRLLCA